MVLSNANEKIEENNATKLFNQFILNIVFIKTSIAI